MKRAAPALVLAMLATTMPARGLAAQASPPPGPESGDALGPLEAVDSARAHAPELAAARSGADAADAEVAAARADGRPDARLSASATRFGEPMIVAPLHGFDPARPPAFDRTLFRGTLAGGYRLWDGGAWRSAALAAEEALSAARSTGRSTEIEVLARTVEAWLALSTAREVAVAAARRTEALEAEAARARERLEQGTAARVEVLRADASLEEARADLAAAEARRMQRRRELARLMGVPAAAVAGRPLAPVELAGDPPAADPPAESDPPAVAAADARARAAGWRIRAARARRLPTVDAEAALLGFGSAGGDHAEEWQAGVQVSWPITTGGARAAAVRRAEAELASAEAALRLARMETGRRLDAAASARVEAEARVAALTASVEGWAEVARIAELAVAEGVGSQIEVLDAQSGLFRARAGLVEARHARILAAVRAAQAEGTLDRAWLARHLEVGP